MTDLDRYDEAGRKRYADYDQWPEYRRVNYRELLQYEDVMRDRLIKDLVEKVFSR